MKLKMRIDYFKLAMSILLFIIERWILVKPQVIDIEFFTLIQIICFVGAFILLGLSVSITFTRTK